MGLKKTLASLIFETEEEDEKKKEQPREPGKVAVDTPRFTGSTPPTNNYVFPQSSGEILVQPDLGVLSFLAEEIKKHNIEGYDYFEFREALEALKVTVPDENMRLKIAFQTVSSLVTPNKLVETAKYYIDHLKFVQKDFSDVTTKEFETTTGVKKAQFNSIDNEVALAEQKIKELNEQIAVLRNTKIQLQGEIAREEAEYNMKQKKFTVSVEAVITGIERDITKLESINGQ